MSNGIYSNLIAQLDKLHKHNRQGSIMDVTRIYLALLEKGGEGTAYKLLRTRSFSSIRIGQKILIPKQSVIGFLDNTRYNDSRIINGRLIQQS